MMKSVAIAMGVLSIVAGAAMTVMMLGFILSGAANTKPEDWPTIRGWLIGVGVGGLVCFVGGDLPDGRAAALVGRGRGRAADRCLHRDIGVGAAAWTMKPP